MNARTAHSASGGAPDLQTTPDYAPLVREDQAALEVGFAPAGGLSWRRRRVAQLRERVDRGTYEVDPGQVAEALLNRLREAS